MGLNTLWFPKTPKQAKLTSLECNKVGALRMAKKEQSREHQKFSELWEENQVTQDAPKMPK